ncbi:MAG: N-acetylmuramic acid 6-phosphate etherase [Bacteroidetes bacterium HGW-Bacteroidetes-21]|jgi:N-acetylmuramic acid 6-phosphate etherase|nr:MAG: N-acetylmuramic acid 6-phosphate etherase [Bacteroidetes bacterium HGW-Bacteroidetes-21]
MEKFTEANSLYDGLENMSVSEIIVSINKEDHKVAKAVKKALPMVEALIQAAFLKMNSGGRLFYLGSGTSGRLGILDASECPPTFGVSPGLVIGIIAGGDHAIRNAVEHAEDDMDAGWKQLQEYKITDKDFVVGISSSGFTPYVIGAIQKCASAGIDTGCITSNPGTPLAAEAHYPIEVIVGPEFVTGSTRMKSGTAQKMTLNIISTSLMIKLGKIKGNKMVDMQPLNNKLLDRGAKMIMAQLNIDYDKALALLKKHGSVRKAIEKYL